MKIPAGAFPQLLQMVSKSLPYEVPFEPNTSEAKVVVSIIQELITRDPQLSELSGFAYHLALNIDKNTAQQISTREFLHRFVDILSTYGAECIDELK